MKKTLCLVLVIAFVMTVFTASTLAAYKEGATVEVDKSSPTGFTATFVYKDSLADYVIFSGDLRFYKPGELTVEEAAKKYYTPYEWEKGMLPAKTSRYETHMTRIEGTDLWTISMPIPSGSFCYQYKVAYAFNGNDTDVDIVIPDPANIAPHSNLERYPKEHSKVFGLFDNEKQIEDRSIVLPRQDTQVGEITYVPITDINGDPKYVGVYLPYGYDHERKEPYKVIYISHGTGGDETEWVSLANAGNIMDNLIAEGKIEPMVMVIPDNNDYPPEESVLHISDTPWDFQDGDIYDTAWNYSLVNRNFLAKILPFIEANYNVSTESQGRAYAGLSRGGFQTTILYVENPNTFGYIGVFSGPWSGLSTPGALDEYDNLDAAKVMVGYGNYDTIGLRNSSAFIAELENQGVDVTETIVFGAHDWFTWDQLFEEFVLDFVWK